MARKTTSMHDWLTDIYTGVGASMWRQPAGTKRTTTTTYERAAKRQDRRIIEDVARHADFHDRVTKSNNKLNQERWKIFNQIVERVKKKHPEMKNIQARNYARKKDPLGRKYQRLLNQGYDAEYIAKKLGYNSKTGKFKKASSGHSGN